MRNREKIMVIVWLIGFLLSSMLLFSSEDPKLLSPGDITLHKEAKKAIYEKDWDQAVQLLQQLDTQFPGSTLRVEALYWLAYSLEKQNKEFEALKRLNRLIETYKNNEWMDDAKMLRVRISADLIQQGHPQYRRYIMEAVQEASNESIDLKMMALDALIWLDRPTALPILEKMYKQSKEQEIKDNIIFILRRCGEDKMISRLAEPGKRKGIITIKAITNAYTYKPRKAIGPPRLIQKVKPVYPKEALEDGIAGDVILIVVLDKKGHVMYAIATKGAHPLLAEAAEKAVKQWKFFPSVRVGKRVYVAFNVTINFSLPSDR